MTLLNQQSLEAHLERLANRTGRFPRSSDNYYDRYVALVNQLRLHVYPNVDAGLTFHSGVDPSTGMFGKYTPHDGAHFDEVVRYAGQLLNADSPGEWDVLTPYELYLLLVAIRIHDAGNIKGRDEHTKRCHSILNDYRMAIGNDSADVRYIAQIAEAHGGKTPQGDKDTIRLLDLVRASGAITFRARALAAVLRFADEICETRMRGPSEIDMGSMPPHSQIYHKYMHAIESCVYDPTDKRVKIEYSVLQSDAIRKWGCETRGEGENAYNERYLIDEIYDRVEKMNTERLYCISHMQEVCTVFGIRAAITIWDEKQMLRLEQISIDLDSSGYPKSGDKRLRDAYKENSGEAIFERLQNRKVV